MSDSEDQGKWLTLTEAEKLQAKVMELNDLLENATKSIRTLLGQRDKARTVRSDLAKCARGLVDNLYEFGTGEHCGEDLTALDQMLGELNDG